MAQKSVASSTGSLAGGPPRLMQSATHTVFNQQQHSQALGVLQKVARKDLQTNERFTKRVSQKVSQYQWPIPKKDPTIEEQILSPMANSGTRLMKLDVPLNTVVEATKQIRTAVRQLQPFNLTEKPITPHTINMVSASSDARSPFGSAKTSIRVNNLMSNGLSYPSAKRITKKSLRKISPHFTNLNGSTSLAYDSVISEESTMTPNNVHFQDSNPDLSVLAANQVALPKIDQSKVSMWSSRHASVSKNREEVEMRQTGMRYYSTFIRRVNEFHIERHRQKKAAFLPEQPEPTQFQKYKKYMDLLEEDDGSFPRVSELSMRLEQDRLLEESHKRLKLAEEETRRQREEAEALKEQERQAILNSSKIESSIEGESRNATGDFTFQLKKAHQEQNKQSFLDGIKTHQERKRMDQQLTEQFDSSTVQVVNLDKSDLSQQKASELKFALTQSSGFNRQAATDALKKNQPGAPSSKHDTEVQSIVVNVKPQQQQANSQGATRHYFEVQENQSVKKQSRLNRKYDRIITQQSETVKHLYKMLSPKMANFERVKKEIEPYDDIGTLREQNIGHRLAEIREKIYKNKYQGLRPEQLKQELNKKKRSSTQRSPARKIQVEQVEQVSDNQPPRIALGGKHSYFNSRGNSQMSEDINEVYANETGQQDQQRGLSPFSARKEDDSPGFSTKWKMQMN